MSNRARLASLALVAIAAAATACSTAATPTPSPTPPAAATPTPRPEIIPILGTTVLRIGTQRVAFLLEGTTALVTDPSVRVATSHLSNGSGDGLATGDGALFETTQAAFQKWPFGTSGSYVTELTFDRAGPWRLAIDVGSGPSAASTELLVDVAESVGVREIGTLAPFSNTKTLKDARGDLATITTHQRADPDLYRVTVAESLFSGNPSVVVFASPSFCTSPTCGPQVDTVVALKDRRRGEADFIHVEVYDNPEEIQGDLSRGVLSPFIAEWGIDSVPHYVNESWVFVLGRDGRITQRFEGYATLTELEAALEAVR